MKTITLKTLHEASLQDIYNQAARHLLKQNAKAKDPKTLRCQYRTTDGKQCAVGCFIADDEYKPEYEGKSAGPVINCMTDFQSNVTQDCLLMRLQSIHDIEAVESWPAELDALAEEFQLVPISAQ